MQLSALSLALTRAGLMSASVPAFSPGDLFTTGVSGGWWDPSDLTTLFQDAAGTTPVTAVEQPVGLMLDKSKGLVLGPELVTNGDLSSSTGWTLTTGWSVSGGYLIQDGTGGGAVYNGTSVVGRWYQYSITVVDTITGGAGATYLNVGGATVAILYNGTPGKTYTGIVYSTGTRAFECNNGGSAHVVKLDNISVRELPGNHAFNNSGNSANFPVLSARYNLLTKTEQFDDAVWTKYQTSVGTKATSPIGTLTADTLIESATSGTHYAKYTLSLSGEVVYSVYVKAKERENVTLQIDDSATLLNGAGASFNVDPASYSFDGGVAYGSGFSFISGSIKDAGNGWYLCSIRVSVPSVSVNAYVFLRNGASPFGSASYLGDGTSGIYIWGADLRVANDALNQPAYQRVNTATDYDTVGFKPYLKVNGTNQWLQTNSIDFTNTAQMFVCAGVRKLSAAAGVVAEHDDPTVWSWTLLSNQYELRPGSYGSYGNSGTYGNAGSLLASPATTVQAVSYSANGVLASDFIAARVNGVSKTYYPEVLNAASGKLFSNYPLYIGARAGTSLFFNGRLYGLVVCGKQATASEITNTETYINQKTGAY